MGPEYFMTQAMLEGRKAKDICGDNPPVGCVLVSGQEIIAKGHTGRPGEPHAEAMALAKLGQCESPVSAYVTLEPCSFHGRTPSCAKALVKSGIKTVFIGLIDPDPRNNGKGLKILEDAGIKVHVGVLATEIERDLSPHLAARTWHTGVGSETCLSLPE